MKKFFSLFAAVLFAGSMMAADLYSFDFTKSQGGWTIDNKELGGIEFVWAQDASYGMKASAYVDGSAHATESWLISPDFDLSAVSESKMVLSHAMNKGSKAVLAVKVSIDGEDWEDLELSEWPAGTSWTYIDAEADLADYVGEEAVKIAFVYASTTSDCPTWEIKTLAINDGEAPAGPDVTFLPSDFAGQGTSGSGGDVTATKDDITISSNKAFGHDAALRVYKDGSLSIVSASEQIGKIVFTFGSYQGTPKDGGLASTIVVNDMEWSVDALASAAYLEKIQIYFGEFEPEPEIEIEEISVARAMEIGEALADNAYTDVEYAVVGYAVSVKEYSTEYNNQTFYMSDDPNAEHGDFTAYRAKPSEPVEVGQRVKVIGKIQKYVGDYGTTIEITGGRVESAEGVENVVLTEKAQKVMLNGVLYIIRNNKMFDVRGAQVR